MARNITLTTSVWRTIETHRERDKMIEGCGVEVIRFSGSSIWRYAADCADEVALTLKAWRWKQRGRNVIALSA